ncbi:histidinol-phosphatase [Wenxinia marina]|uniref:Histidinol-phosphatase n=1 Tax=Wenxinia marina DSM 24838 TaxID=1123501 RepID=A0A0D0QBL1_9RHOB|nr:histidinol-phosphatase [Wenxinia marina]KIQ68333.1 histidinol-phosphate phosphatase HisN, inositol monophosphatase family [Wenxinia marina DSM 24838]GGL73004.1 histidinol-phosphatase [Wenxinia marina]
MANGSTDLDPATRADLVDVARQLADVARPETLRHFRSAALAVDDKGDGRFDPVTEADRAAERAMREVLAARRPDDGILGEEFGRTEGTSGIDWILDPIDGTRGYMSGTPTWGVLIAAATGGRPVLGIIDQPFIGERFLGGLGHAECTGPQGAAPLRCRAARPLAEATLFTTFPEVGTPDERRGFEAVARQARLVRYGMDCYAYALVAAGQVDLVIEAGLAPYDIAGPLAVVEAAGGIVTDWQGGDASGGGRVIAAANREVHAEALALLSGMS